jgi:hypothetical protein
MRLGGGPIPCRYTRVKKLVGTSRSGRNAALR